MNQIDLLQALTIEPVDIPNDEQYLSAIMIYVFSAA